MLLETLGAILLRNMLTGRGILRACYGNKERKGILSYGYGSKNPPHPLTIIERRKYYENESRFSGEYFRNNLPRNIKDWAYAINLDEYADVGTHWIVLYTLNNDIFYLDSFGVEHITKEIKTFIGKKNIQTNIFRIQANNCRKIE